MKNINELTELEAREILNLVVKDVSFDKVQFESIIEPDGKVQITFSGGPLIGIHYRNDHNDGCILPFNDTKVVLWLYKNGYDITEFLEMNSHYSELENDYDNMAFALYYITKVPPRPGYKDFTLEQIKNKLSKLHDEYLNKEYE